MALLRLNWVARMRAADRSIAAPSHQAPPRTTRIEPCPAEVLSERAPFGIPDFSPLEILDLFGDDRP